MIHLLALRHGRPLTGASQRIHHDAVHQAIVRRPRRRESARCAFRVHALRGLRSPLDVHTVGQTDIRRLLVFGVDRIHTYVVGADLVQVVCGTRLRLQLVQILLDLPQHCRHLVIRDGESAPSGHRQVLLLIPLYLMAAVTFLLVVVHGGQRPNRLSRFEVSLVVHSWQEVARLYFEHVVAQFAHSAAALAQGQVRVVVEVVVPLAAGVPAIVRRLAVDLWHVAVVLFFFPE